MQNFGISSSNQCRQPSASILNGMQMYNEQILLITYLLSSKYW